jgi:hypothetical protein
VNCGVEPALNPLLLGNWCLFLSYEESSGQLIQNMSSIGFHWPFYKNPEAFKFFSIPDTHVLAVLPDEPHVLAISLFGGSYTALVPLQEDGPPKWSSLRDGRVSQISLKDKQFEQWPYGDYLLARPWISPSTPQ